VRVARLHAMDDGSPECKSARECDHPEGRGPGFDEETQEKRDEQERQLHPAPFSSARPSEIVRRQAAGRHWRNECTPGRATRVCGICIAARHGIRTRQQRSPQRIPSSCVVPCGFFVLGEDPRRPRHPPPSAKLHFGSGPEKKTVYPNDR